MGNGYWDDTRQKDVKHLAEHVDLYNNQMGSCYTDGKAQCIYVIGIVAEQVEWSFQHTWSLKTLKTIINSTKNLA